MLTVWRNKAKEAKRFESLAIAAALPEEWASRPDVLIRCSKQRNYAGLGDGEPRIALWWDGGSYHYLAKPGHLPREIVPFSAHTGGS